MLSLLLTPAPPTYLHQPAIEELEYVILSEVSNIIIQYNDLGTHEKNSKGLEIEMGLENELGNDVTINEIGQGLMVEQIEEMPE